MKKLIRKGVVLATMTLAMGTAYSQLKITGEIRPRTEYRHGYKALPDSAMRSATFTDQRTRLNFEYKKDRTQLKLSLQDVRVWGSQKQLVTNEDYGISVHEAWGLTKLNDAWSVKFGRQEIVYDDHRIFGNVGWTQQARSHDAFLIKYGKNKLVFDIGIAYNQDKAQLKTTSYTVPKSYKSMQYLWGNYKASDNLKISFLVLNVGQQVNFVNEFGQDAFHDNYTQTAGGRAVYKKDKFGFNFNGYYQMGSTKTFPAKNVSAYDIAFDLSYQVAKKFKATLGYERLSGNSQTDTSASYNKTERAFNPYFGTNHKFNGFMDYFYVGNYIGSAGLNDIQLRFDYKHEKFSAGVATHIFLTAANVLDTKELANTGNYTAMSSYLGTEIDIFGAFKLAPGTTCKLGYSQMLGTSTLQAVRGGKSNEIANWGYVMLIMKPTLFESKPEVKKEIIK